MTAVGGVQSIFNASTTAVAARCLDVRARLSTILPLCRIPLQPQVGNSERRLGLPPHSCATRLHLVTWFSFSRGLPRPFSLLRIGNNARRSAHRQTLRGGCN